MGKRKDPINEVVAWFENADIHIATMMLSIAKGIVVRRQPTLKAAVKRAARRGRTPTGDELLADIKHKAADQ